MGKPTISMAFYGKTHENPLYLWQFSIAITPSLNGRLVVVVEARQLKHPNVVRLLTAYLDDSQLSLIYGEHKGENELFKATEWIRQIFGEPSETLFWTVPERERER